MNKYVILTDMTCDLNPEYFTKNNVERLTLPFEIDGVTYNKFETLMPYPEFYQTMRDGKMPKTSQVNQYDAAEIFTKYLEEGYDILHLCFSSGVSGSFDGFKPTLAELKEKYPDRKIIVIDSKAGSGALGIMLDKALKQKAAGKSMEEISKWIETNKLKFHHLFMVEDLQHLKRSGRLSKAEAALGQILGVKPILSLDAAGKIDPVAKVRGSKKAYAKMIELTVEEYDPANNDFIVVSHGDWLEKAKEIGDEISQKVGLPIVYCNVNYLIGSHVGPKAMAVFYYSKKSR